MKTSLQQTRVIYGEGNNGGDYLRIEELPDDVGMLSIEVGSSCVIVLSSIVPVEVLTAMIRRALVRYDTVDEFIQSLDWPQEFKDKLEEKWRSTNETIPTH